MDAPYDLSWTKTEFKLTSAEYKVLGYLSDGKTPKQISEITGTTVSTVRVHIFRIYGKTNVSNMAELTALLLQRAKGA